MQQISFMLGASLCNLSDKEPGYKHFRHQLFVTNYWTLFLCENDEATPLNIALICNLITTKINQLK